MGAVWLALYLVFAPVDLYRVAHASQEDRPAAVQDVADFVDARPSPGGGARVVARLPRRDRRGAGAGARERLRPHDAASLTPDERQRYHLASAEQVEQLIRERCTRLVVVKLWHVLPPVPDYDGAARRAGYRLISTINGARIYEAP